MSLLFLLIWNWNNKFAHTLRSRTPLENHTWFETQKSKVYTCFRLFSDQNSAKTLPFGAAHNYMAYIREYLPPDKPVLLWTVTVKGIDSQSHIAEHGNKAVITKILSCWVYEINRRVIEQLECHFGFIFLLFPMKVAGGYTHKSLAPGS